MVHLRDIAERAGVSTATVSHVLNSSRPVHPATAARVLEAVQELNYRPNMLARSLRRHETRTIGLLVSSIENPYLNQVAHAVETTAHDRGYNVILCNTDESLTKEVMYVDVLLGKQVDGLILAPAPGDHAYLQTYLDEGARVVLVNRDIPGLSAPAVIRDDDVAMYALTSRLLAGGHRRLAAIIGLEGVTTTQRCLAGFQRAVEEHGLTLEEVWRFPAASRREGAYQAARAFLDLTSKPTAVIAFNSHMQDGFLQGLLDLAPDMIRRISIAGFGYSVLARACQSCRFYVAQPSYALGRVATTVLLDALAGVAPLTTERIVLASKIAEFGPMSTDDLQTIRVVDAMPTKRGSLTQAVAAVS